MIIMRNKRDNMRDSKHKIYVVFFGFWGLPPDPHRSSTLYPTGGLPSDPLSFAPQPLTPGDAIATVGYLRFKQSSADCEPNECHEDKIKKPAANRSLGHADESKISSVVRSEN